MKKFLVGIVVFLFMATFSSILALLLVITSVIAGVTSASEEKNIDNIGFEFLGLSDAVLEHREIVEAYALEHGLSDYVNVILAIMMQESSGFGNDPMQSSESKCGEIGCITDPHESIEQGILYFKEALEKSNNNLLVAIQAYNYGIGFVDFVMENGGNYTPELAIAFSQEMYQREVENGRGNFYNCTIGEAFVLGACYGDYLYVQHVMRYVNNSSADSGTGTWSNPLPIEMRVTSGFRTADRPNHNGIDYSCNRQFLPIYAVDDGVVEESLYGKPPPNGNGFGGYGNIVLIKHNDNLYSLYAHLNDRFVTKGQTVVRGQTIGTCGGSGNSGLHHYTIHLHLEARTTKYGGQISPATLFY